MAIKSQELIDGCFARAFDDEPLFVLRANDPLAPTLVREWAHRYGMRKVAARAERWEEKHRSALDLADQMEWWLQRKSST